MESHYLLMGVSLSGGSWAEWFSGTMSALAVIVALSAYPLANRYKKKEQSARDEEIGRSIGWKLLGVLNHTADIDRHIVAGLTSMPVRIPPDYKFPHVRPLGVPERVLPELNQAEIDFLLKAKAAELLMETDMCIGRYSSIVYAMNQYKNRHEALFELMPTPIANQGTTFTHQLTPKEREKVTPYAIMLDALLDEARALISENMARAASALQQYNRDMAGYFGKPLLTFETDEALAADQSQRV